MRNTTRKLRRVKDRIIKDLKESILSLADLGKRYGVSKQAVFEFAQRRGIKRPRRPKREHTKTCPICQSIIRIAKKPHSDFISSKTIRKQLRLDRSKLPYHFGILRKEGLISSKFGRLHSCKAELAYQLYFKKRLPVRTIGRQAGFKNFYAVIKRHRVLGWDVPAPLFKYDSNDRSKAALKRAKKSR
jgi:hypothetical protein